MSFKNFILTLIFVAVVAVVQEASAGFPVRNWDDDMPRHTFSLEAGPGLSIGEISRLGFQTTLRYDWSYFRGFDVAMAAGATYIFSAASSRGENSPEYRGEIRLGENIHYIGVNALNTKIWLGKRTIWDVCIHMGYRGGNSWMKAEGGRQSVAEHGFMAGISTGLDFLVTAWLGVGVRVNAMTGVAYPSDSSAARECSSAALTVGAVHCF